MNILVAIIAGAITITGFFITRYLERKKLIDQQIRDQKIPVYEEFIEFMLRTFTNAEAEKPTHDEMVKQFMKFNRKSIIWFPSETLKEYINWKKKVQSFSQHGAREIPDVLAQILAIEKFMLSLRKDIGHKDKHLKKGDLASTFINDLDKYEDILKQLQ